jgi:hypothetical protein
MVANFQRELATVGNADVVGFYGSAHTGLDSLDSTGRVPCMAKQLKSLPCFSLTSDDLSFLAKEIVTATHRYRAFYYGRQDLRGFKNDSHRDYWQLENAYDDGKNAPKTGDLLPDNNDPMVVLPHQVYRIEYTLIDGSTTVRYSVSQCQVWDGLPVTENIEPR